MLSKGAIILPQLGIDESYELLNVIDFTSSRKRMSVIVRDAQGMITLICKGAVSSSATVYNHLSMIRSHRWL